MKVRKAKKPVEPPVEEGGDPRVKVVFVQKPTKMVTLEDPEASLHGARGAFARLKPPETLSPAETQSWADRVRTIARAVRVLPTRRSAALATSTQVDVMPVGTIREEIDGLIREADDVDLFTLNEEILAEVEDG